MARHCLALLRNSNSCLEVVQEAVRNLNSHISYFLIVYYKILHLLGSLMKIYLYI